MLSSTLLSMYADTNTRMLKLNNSFKKNCTQGAGLSQRPYRQTLFKPFNKERFNDLVSPDRALRKLEARPCFKWGFFEVATT